MYLCTHDSPNINQEIMTSLQEKLFAMQDKLYADFQAKLTPGLRLRSLQPDRAARAKMQARLQSLPSREGGRREPIRT